MPCPLAVFPREPADTTASAQSRPVHRPRKPEASPLRQLVTNQAHTFLDLYDDRSAPRYGPLRAVVPRAPESFQRCGLLAHGFARLAYETIRDLLQAAGGTHNAVPGAVACLQSDGNLLDWHPQVHLLISWGLFRRDGSFIPQDSEPT